MKLVPAGAHIVWKVSMTEPNRVMSHNLNTQWMKTPEVLIYLNTIIYNLFAFILSAEPVIEEALQHATAESHFIHVNVGERS